MCDETINVTDSVSINVVNTTSTYVTNTLLTNVMGTMSINSDDKENTFAKQKHICTLSI